jgi:Ca-activated chloride channel family protein
MRWPSFIFPFGAWFFLALIPLAILYFLKLKRPRHTISSLVLWQAVIDDQRVNSPFQKFRRNLLLLLQLILLCLIILALMQPFLSSGPEAGEYVPVLIDCSASMAATVEGSDQTRLDLAKEQASQLFGSQQVALFSFAATGRRLTEFTRDEHQLTNALEKLKPTDLQGRLDDVLRVVAAYSRSYPIERAIVFTDGNVADTIDFELPFGLDVRKVDPGGPNVGITEMNAQRTGAEDWDVFLRVAGSTDDLQEAEITLYQDGQPVAKDMAEVALDESERFVFPVSTGDPTLLKAELAAVGSDALPADNVAWLSLPKARNLRVRVSPELFSWRHAMQVMPRIDVDDGPDSERATYDLVVSDSDDLQGSEAPVNILIGVIPADLKGLVSVEDGFADVVDWNRTAPILRHVQLREVQIGQQIVFAENVSDGDLEERGYEVLVLGARGPLVLQKREGLKVSFYFLFHTDQSTLPYRIAFPILVSNAVDNALRNASLSEVKSAPTGVLPPLNVEADREYVIRSPQGDEVQLTSTATGVLTGAPAGTVGRYDVLDGDEVVLSVGTGLLSPLETSLTAVDELKFTELNVTTGDAEASLLDSEQPLWWILALGAFVFLLLEWWYFSRARGSAV